MANARTEEQKIFMEPIQITLGGVSYTVHPLKIGASKKWRECSFKPLVESAKTVIESFLAAKDSQATVPLSNLADAASWLVIEAFDASFDAVCGYSPEIGADRERIYDEAYDVEVIDALVAVIKLAFPLSKAAEILGMSLAPAAPAQIQTASSPKSETETETETAGTGTVKAS